MFGRILGSIKLAGLIVLVFFAVSTSAHASPPTATVVVANPALKIGDTSLVTITFSEPVSGFSNADLSIQHGTLTAVSSSDGGVTWTATFTPSAGITAPANLITLDLTGVQNGGSEAGTGSVDSNNYAINTQRPTATIAVAPSQLIGGQTAAVVVTFSEVVTGFSLGLLTSTNATLSNPATSDNITYTVTLTAASGVAAASNSVSLNLSGVTDVAGNAGTGTAVSNNYAVGLLPQSIAFGAQASQTYASGGTFAINPPAIASSGLPVTYSSLTTGVCTVSGSTVAMISAGTCTLAADQAGNGTYAAASEVTRNVVIAMTTSSAALIASLNPSSVGQAVTFTATVSGLSPTGTVTFNDGATTLGTGPLSSGQATLTTSALTSGTHAITAVYGGDANSAR